MLREMCSVKAWFMKFQRGTKTICNPDRVHLCDTLAKYLASFCLCPESCSGAELKDNVLVN